MSKTPAKASKKPSVGGTAPENGIVVGKSGKYEVLDLKFGNRHGLITGATGTGKTVTLQVLAEGFSQAGVPVFAADIKGDLSGVSAAGEAKEALVQRAEEMGLSYQPDEFPVVFWDVFGAAGPSDPRHHLGNGTAAAVADDGAQRHAGRRAQHRLSHRRRAGACAARSEGSARDPRPGGRERRRAAEDTGNVSTATVGTIQRQLLVLENQGAKLSSASRRSTSTTSCAPTATAAASSTSWRPTS